MVAAATLFMSLDIFLLAALCTLASLVLVVRTWMSPPKAPQPDKRAKKKPPAKKTKRRAKRPSSRKKIIIDGSNVMHWHNQTPRLDTVRDVIEAVVDAGYTPGIIFDANAGYKLNDRYMRDTEFSNLLGLGGEDVMVVDSGVDADHVILQAARDYKASIVTLDQYRNWADDFPEITDPKKLIKGGYTNGVLWIEL